MVFHLLASRITAVAANAMSVFVLVKLLDPRLYGEFAYTLSMLLMVGQIARMGMQSVVLKRGVQSKRYKSFWFTGYLANHLIINAVLCAVIALYLYSVNVTMDVKLCVLATVGSVLRLNMLIEPLLQARSMFKELSEFTVVTAIIGVLVKLTIGLHWPEYIYTSLLFETIIFVGYVFLRLKKSFAGWIDFRLFKFNAKLLQISLPFAISGVFYLMNSRLDQVLVRHMGVATDLPNYMLLIKLAEILSIFSMSICTVITTLALHEVKKKGQFKSATLSYYKYTGIIVAAAIAGAVCFPKAWFVAIVGQDYLPVYDLRFHLILLYLMYAFTQYLGVIVLVRNLQGFAAFRSACIFLINIPIYYVCYATWGISGLLVGMAASNTLVSLFFYAANKKSRIAIQDLLLR